MKSNLWLCVGIASVSVVVGYMVGASSTPVAGVAIPLVFGLIVTGIGLITPAQIASKFKLPDVIDTGERVDEVKAALQGVTEELQTLPAQVGKVLTVLAISYGMGLFVGTKTRIDHWFVKTPAVERTLPWSNDLPPPTAKAALEWVATQERLLALGYTEQQIQAIYRIQRDEWSRVSARGQTHPIVHGSSGARGAAATNRGAVKNEDHQTMLAVVFPTPVPRPKMEPPMSVGSPPVLPTPIPWRTSMPPLEPRQDDFFVQQIVMPTPVPLAPGVPRIIMIPHRR